jgi:hypothetical protein
MSRAKIVDGFTEAGTHVEAWEGSPRCVVKVDGEEVEVVRDTLFRDGGSRKLETSDGGLLWVPQNTFPAGREFRAPEWCGEVVKVEGSP